MLTGLRFLIMTCGSFSVMALPFVVLVHAWLLWSLKDLSQQQESHSRAPGLTQYIWRHWWELLTICLHSKQLVLFPSALSSRSWNWPSMAERTRSGLALAWSAHFWWQKHQLQLDLPWVGPHGCDPSNFQHRLQREVESDDPWSFCLWLPLTFQLPVFSRVLSFHLRTNIRKLPFWLRRLPSRRLQAHTYLQWLDPDTGVWSQDPEAAPLGRPRFGVVT